MQDKVIGRTREDRIHASGASPRIRARNSNWGALAFLKVSGMAFRQNPFQGEPCGVGRDAEEFRVFERPAPFRGFLPQDVAADAAFFLLEVLSASVDFLLHARRDDRGERSVGE